MKSIDTIFVAMEIVVPKLRSLKHEKRRNENCHQDAIKPTFPQQTTFGKLFMEKSKKPLSSGELLHENCRNVFFKNMR